MAGEFDFVEWVQSRHRAGDFVVVPPGDDLAALKWPGDDLLLVGADQVLDGVHFDSAVHAPRQIGRKVMNRNLSDCAAMACLPAAAVATAALPRGAGLDYARELYLGMSEAGAAFNCPVVGGDTATWDGKLVLTLTILGRSAGIQPIVRCGARAGEDIYVTGPLGGSLAGRHMTFEPRVALARELAATGRISAMIDISDGLSRDLGHVCRQSGVGAVVVAGQVPVHENAIGLSSRDGRSPLDHALHDGEDHELLFTATPGPYVGSTRIGTIVAEQGVWLEMGTAREPLEARGWEHRL